MKAAITKYFIYMSVIAAVVALVVLAMNFPGAVSPEGELTGRGKSLVMAAISFVMFPLIMKNASTQNKKTHKDQA